jgi:hypothetical protein
MRSDGIGGGRVMAVLNRSVGYEDGVGVCGLSGQCRTMYFISVAWPFVVRYVEASKLIGKRS